ncbi:NUDIX hydrolase [Arthrobacter sp. AK01]|uniref:NUDIX hydrolase n=1 Tax=Micrococcaceae TaxID=1268 RepID=UPI001E459F27|nr:MULTISPECIES: NUDIX hydrolase [Micrococcaceae]MCD4853495.1 NUDIX hydrolase [Arthrobacter sp. AK01]MCP1410803.1 ADP-ribose pyrophosphatase [Paenarthrobacter sp. A20]
MTEPDELWRKLWSTRAYKGFVTINRDTYLEADGSVSEWDVIAGPDSAAMLAFTEGGAEVVMFEQFRVGPGRTLLELPGGYVNQGETPESAARRELAEETGYESSAIYYTGSEWRSARSSSRKHVAIAAEARPGGDPSWDASEAGFVRLLPSHELLDFLLSGDLTDAGLACRGLLKFALSSQQDAALEKLQVTVRSLLSGY